MQTQTGAGEYVEQGAAHDVAAGLLAEPA